MEYLDILNYADELAVLESTKAQIRVWIHQLKTYSMEGCEPYSARNKCAENESDVY